MATWFAPLMRRLMRSQGNVNHLFGAGAELFLSGDELQVASMMMSPMSCLAHRLLASASICSIVHVGIQGACGHSRSFISTVAFA